MSATGHGPDRISPYSMRIECPQCGQKMMVHVGFTGDPQNNEIKCLGCHNRVLPLVPGPIVDGPFVD